MAKEGNEKMNEIKVSKSIIYDYFVLLGFWEIRKWHELKPGDIERYNEEAK